MRFAKESGTAVFVVGHVTKGGGIAGPKTLEHIVDTVLYFEGEGSLDHRVLRATKNRFGGVDEIGVFRMTSAASSRSRIRPSSSWAIGLHAASGSAVTALMEGTRPLLVEIQALAAKAGFGTPQRVSTGFDGRRLALLLAVLDKRAGLSFAQLDVFVNVVGGVRLHEPAGDLAVAAALASSVYDRPLPPHALFLGEVGLGGEVRPVSQSERRLAEGAKMGLTTAYLAERAHPETRAGRERRGRAHDQRRLSAPCSNDRATRPTSASSSSRRERHRALGGGELKQFRWIAGKPMLLHTLQLVPRRVATWRWSSACCRGSTPAIRRHGSFSAMSTAC